MRLVLIVVFQKFGPKRYENLTINEKGILLPRRAHELCFVFNNWAQDGLILELVIEQPRSLWRDIVGT